MKTYTDLEKQVYNAIVEICVEYPEANVEDIAEDTGLNKNTIKGVVGSLVKKEMVHVDEDKRDFKTFKTINPLDSNGVAVGFMCDTHDDEEIEAMKLK